MENNSRLEHFIAESVRENEESLEYNNEAIHKEVDALKEAHESSTLIKVLSVIGGILTSLAFVAFLFASKLFESSFLLITIGVIAILVSYFINLKIKKTFVETLGISAYLIGTILISIGLSNHDFNVEPESLTLINLLLALVSYAVARTFTFNLITILHVIGSIIAYIFIREVAYSLDFFTIIIASLYTFVLSNESSIIKGYAKFSSSYSPLRTGLMLTLLFCLYNSMGFYFPFEEGYRPYYLISPALILLNNFIILKVIKRFGVNQLSPKLRVFIMSNLIFLLIFSSPQLIGAILILLSCFYVNYKLGIGVGILAFIYSISHFYYYLEYTLLTKSILLMTSGLLFLTFYFIIRKTMNNE